MFSTNAERRARFFISCLWFFRVLPQAIQYRRCLLLMDTLQTIHLFVKSFIGDSFDNNIGVLYNLSTLINGCSLINLMASRKEGFVIQQVRSA